MAQSRGDGKRAPSGGILHRFPGRRGGCSLRLVPDSHVFSAYLWDRTYLTLAEDCHIEEIDFAVQPGAPDTLTSAIPQRMRSSRDWANVVIRSIAQHHPKVGPGVLNPVEERNIEVARWNASTARRGGMESRTLAEAGPVGTGLPRGW
jgi:hypothetical protein